MPTKEALENELGFVLSAVGGQDEKRAKEIRAELAKFKTGVEKAVADVTGKKSKPED